MAEAVDVEDQEIENNEDNERILTNTFPALCPNMIGELVRSGTMDLVQMVTHLSGEELKNNEQKLTDTFPELCPNMIGQLVRSGTMDLVQMVAHLSDQEIKNNERILTDTFPELAPNMIGQLVRSGTMDLPQMVTHLSDEDNINNKRILTDAFPKLCPDMIGQLVCSGRMDLVQMVAHLSGLDVEARRKTLFEMAKALTQKPDNAEAYTETEQNRKPSQANKYTSEFKVEEFVALIPNPEETFNKPTRDRYLDLKTVDYVERYFMNKYPSIYKSDISKLLRNYVAPERKKFDALVMIDEQLASKMEQGLNVMKCRRKPTPLNSPGEDILLLQELAYVDHRAEIRDYLENKKQDEAHRKQYAIDNGLTVTCQCCFTDGLMIEEAFTCNKDCSFCPECIRKSCELKLGEDNIQFPCLANCGSQFAWTTLQAALPPTLFSKLSLRWTESEIRASGIKLDSCPSCNFTSIIDENYTSLQCLNPDCMKLAYVGHTPRSEIQDYILNEQQDEAQRKQYAIDNGLTVTCQCCFMDGLMIEEAFTCNKDCSFCPECIKKSCELKLGEDNIQFPCLADCGSQFAWTTLQAALPPTLFAKLSLRCTESEIQAAGIKLDSCPSCNFTNIIDENYTLFQCLNPDCMKDTCRLCKEPNHLPLRCDEEKDEEVKARVHVENKMTGALLRTCWRCNRKFIKDRDSCNKITCVCGAMSCYVCNKPVENYEHFNGLGGDKYHLCPLFNDIDAMHQKEIAEAAEEAKKEVDPNKLKVDPSEDINEYFENKRKKMEA